MPYNFRSVEDFESVNEALRDLEFAIQGIDVSIAEGGAGASELNQLSDVNTSTPTSRFVLVADGVDFESRLLVELDISDLKAYALASALHTRSHAISSTNDHTATNWRLFHSNGSGEIVEVGLGVADQVLTSNGVSSAPSFKNASGSGSWVQIGSETVPPESQTFDITWDESLYRAIRFELYDIRVSTTSAQFNLRVGSGNGGTIYDNSGDYDGIYHNHGTASWFVLADTTLIPCTGGDWSGTIAADSLHATIEILHGASANTGCLVRARVSYKNGSVYQVYNVDAKFIGANVAIDTLQFMVTAGKTFTVNGGVKLWGLLI